MNTLVIHPADKSTDFLKPIYQNSLDTTVLTGGTKVEVNKAIESHDRIMMMGHGSPYGLFTVGKFKSENGYVIDGTTVKLLKDKECIFIWCNADAFTNKHGLDGLYSGMFISEVSEAYYCGLPYTSQEEVDQSNHGFFLL